MTGNPIGSPLKLSQISRFSQPQNRQEIQNDLSKRHDFQRGSKDNDEDNDEGEGNGEEEKEKESGREKNEGEVLGNVVLDARGKSEPIPTHKGKQVKNQMDAFTNSDLFDSPTLPSFSVDSSMIGSLQVGEQSFSYGFVEEKNDD